MRTANHERDARVLPYVVALAATAVAVAVRWFLHPWLGERLPLTTLFPALAVTVWYGGYRPAVPMALLGYVACHILFIAPGPGIAHLLVFLIYLVACSFFIALAEAMRSARRRADESREVLRVTLASIGDAVIATCVEGKITFLNSVAERLTGWTQKEAVGKPLDSVFRIINEQTRETVHNPAAKALRDGVIVGLANHTVLITKDGTERPIDDSAAPIRDDQGAVTGCVLVFRDVTERRRAEIALQRNEKELSDFFDNATVGLNWIGPDGIILRANKAELDMLGYRPEEYIGHPIADFHVDRSVIDDMLARLAAGETVTECSARMRRKDGSIRDVLISSSVLFENGKFVHTRSFTLDVTDRKRAQEAQVLLANIVAASDDAIVSKSLDGIIQSWNDGAVRLFGYTAEEAIGKPISLIIPPELQDEERSILARLARGERIEHFETVRVTKDGRRLDISLTVSPVRDEQGRIVGASKVARDVTERKRATERLAASEGRFRELANNIDQFVWTCDALGYVTWYNRRWYDYTGTTFEETKGDGWKALVDPAHIDRVVAGLERSAALEEPWQDIFPLRGKDGTYRWFLSRSVPIRDETGRVVRWFGTNTDITQQRQLEEALREADRRKDEFLATLAHELRNPLAPIRNAAQIFLLQDPSDPKLTWALEVIDRQVQQMARLLDDLLDVSRISHNKLSLRKQRIELKSVIQSAVETSRPLIDEGRHDLAIDLPPQPVHLDVDPVRLAQIFSNLLNNAAKYTEAGGHIRLAAEVEDGQVAISVKDDGIGISAQTLPHIFEMFTQGNFAMERSQGGLGIGLSLVRGLVELHGGRIEARSEGLGKGSEFIVRLPLPQASRPRVNDGNGSDRDTDRAFAAKRRLLIVDDHKDNADGLAMLLKLMGHDVATAYGGGEAIASAAEFKPDVVLLDIGMPGLDGYETCRQLRRQPGGERLFLIALTGWGKEDDRRRTEEAGFNHHMVKPVDPDALIKLLTSLPEEATER